MNGGAKDTLRRAALPLAIIFVLGFVAGWFGHGLWLPPALTRIQMAQHPPQVPAAQSTATTEMPAEAAPDTGADATEIVPASTAAALPQTSAAAATTAESSTTPQQATQQESRETLQEHAGDAATQPSGPFIGNTQTRIFHRAGCRYAKCKHCTANFATREEALAAGYAPCKAEVQ